jgi:hypothetical protein
MIVKILFYLKDFRASAGGAYRAKRTQPGSPGKTVDGCTRHGATPGT